MPAICPKCHDSVSVWDIYRIPRFIDGKKAPYYRCAKCMGWEDNTTRRENMKRLFAVKKPNGKIIEKYYDDKQKAKDARRKENGVDEKGKEQLRGYTVTYGPDHWKYEGKLS